jgi:Glycosyltransferase family 92
MSSMLSRLKKMVTVSLAICLDSSVFFRPSSSTAQHVNENGANLTTNNTELVVLSSAITAATVRPTLALCLITKDENRDLLEWVEYHYSIGVTKVIIVDNNSSISAIASVMKYARSGFVVHYTYFSQNMLPNNQLYAYDYCLKTFGAKYSHMGFIDTDEFIVLKNNSATVIDVLEKYSAFGALTLNWMFMGSNGHIKRPAGGVLKNYNKCWKNCHVKSIVNTKLIEGLSGDPHHFKYISGYYAVDTNYSRIDGPWNPPSQSAPPDYLYDVIYINHYVLKSLQDFKHKRNRGSGDGGVKQLSFFKAIDRDMKATCDFLSRRNQVFESQGNLSLYRKLL